MGWKEQNAIKRIFNTFKRIKNGIYEQDVEALKQLKESNENNDKQTVFDNKLYSKLLIVILKQNLEYYGDMKLAISETSRMLKMTIPEHIKILERTLNMQTSLSFLKGKGIDFENLIKDETETINANKQELIDHFSKSWTYENVEKSFYRTANDFLKDVENYG